MRTALMTRAGAVGARYRPLLVLTAAIWLAHGVNAVMQGALTPALGLVPRRLDGLDGVLFMPLLHGGLDHLVANTVPLLVLGAIMLTIARRAFWRVTAFVVLVGGLMVWVFGRTSIHIGASGLVFGWFGFVIALAVFQRSVAAMIGALLAAALYGAPTLLGLAPTAEGVSWDAHLAGLLAGIGAAWAVAGRGRRARR